MNRFDAQITAAGKCWPFAIHLMDRRLEPFRDRLPVIAKDQLAETFQVCGSAEQNARWWRLQLTQATRTGLADCRATLGRAGNSSTFYPERVANWLLRNEHLSADVLVEILRIGRANAKHAEARMRAGRSVTK